MSPLKKIRVPLLLVLVALAIYWWRSHPAEKTAQPVGSSGVPSKTAVASVPAADPILPVFGSLGNNPAGSDSLSTLKDLQAKLKAMPAGEAVSWIRSFLANGTDKSTGLAFEIGTGGTLTGWPTFRTFLIDTLLAIDPQAAAEMSRQILGAPTTADEWALALRNVGKADTSTESNAYLREKAEALIANPEWQANPSVGYLNAFDVLVHTNSTESTPLLSSLIQRKDRRDLAHAGFLTLDRLVERQPVDVLTRLAADQDLQQSRPEMTAQEFARADLRDPAQQAIVKSWLLDPARTGTELHSFAGVYPNNNRFISNNLLTTGTTPTGSDLAAHDREVLEIINTWQADPAFQPVLEHLRAVSSRLESFVVPGTSDHSSE
ncbi:MAG: hypothetical protein V4689_00080 [Verrucomicrobiota bacterium]